ncbi:RNA-binding signal recognition particle subunit SRP14 [Kluyveromyces lactis]|uniref:KLLA0F07117p n=1 Tax=Kluyveromyces lactis (strain ATCC 8585 / CBS 2359 / DSM 70799 / NBRC 1267 / NRRL Y-1140 / WM37) TaxID=284590 RepID=Q6CKY6_KLULA|nr:uncharacterized protein KLLA0_F07117g [Kluyveromyces lactis]CAG98111.1 KLLA0F07117p [Kluyveromyces lactis]|eukprot:XP_455403.1 uncharacterized protein KLLA0_F07117g [Kluyveromyces lactis]
MSDKDGTASGLKETPDFIKKPLSHDEFFVKLEKAFRMSKVSHNQLKVSLKRDLGSHHVQKPNELDVTSNPTGDISKMSESKRLKQNAQPDTKPYRLIVLVSMPYDGKRTKFFTLVDSKTLDKFWKDYVNVVKTSMSGLIKKKKKKKGGKKN